MSVHTQRRDGVRFFVTRSGRLTVSASFMTATLLTEILEPGGLYRIFSNGLETTLREHEDKLEIGTIDRKWADLGVHTYVKIAVLGILFLLVFRREVDSLVNTWNTDASWSHGWLIPLFSIYLINQYKKQILSITPKVSIVGLSLLVLGLIWYPMNIVHFQYGYLNPMGMIGTLGALVLFMCGWRLLRYLWLPVLFLGFAVPLPQRLYVAITMPMRQIAAAASTGIMNLVSGLEATRNGVTIDVMYHGVRLEPALDVADACSGMRLLMAFVALGVVMAYLHYRPVWQRLVLLASTIPIAIICNIVRVTITGFIYVLWEPKYAQGVYHDGLGILMLPLAFGLYGFIAWFMSSLFVEEKEVKEEVIVAKRVRQEAVK